MKNYLLGQKVTEENYIPLRNLALKLTSKEFRETTGFGHGVHNRIRRFDTYLLYKEDEKERAIKYGYIKKKRDTERVTVNDVYSKLVKLESEIMEIKRLVSQ